MQTRPYVPDRRGSDPALVAAGTWLRLTLVGVAAFLGSLVALARSSERSIDVVLLAICGAWLAVVAWRRSRSGLDRAEAL